MLKPVQKNPNKTTNGKKQTNSQSLKLLKQSIFDAEGFSCACGNKAPPSTEQPSYLFTWEMKMASQIAAVLLGRKS